MTAFSVGHFCECANAAVTVEWRVDADTKLMLGDLAMITKLQPSAEPKLFLRVDWHYYPELKYYSGRREFSWLAVGTAPPFRSRDLYYLRDSEVPPSLLPRLSVLKSYPRTGSILARREPE